MDIAIVFAYFAGLIVIGSRSFRIVKGINSFFVADRASPLILIAGSLFATVIGGSSTVGMAGLGYSMGLVGSWWLLVGAIGLFALALFLAERVRAYSLYTLPEILDIQYGPEAKVSASVLIVIAWMGIVAGQIVAAGKILETILETSPSLLMVITALVFITYTLLGGQHSVVRTDTVQSVIIIVAIVVSIPLCLHKVGGLGAMIEVLGPDHFSFPVSSRFPWTTLVTYLFLVGSTYLVGPDIYSRIFCAKDKRVAKGATMTVALTLVPFAFIITILGMAAGVLFPGINPEAAFPTMIHRLFPIGLNGLIIAALLSAMMSSADTCLLTTSTILSFDIVRPLVRRELPEGTLLLFSRVFIVLIGVISLIIALSLKGVISSLLLGYTVYTSGLIFPILLGFYKGSLGLNKEGAIAAMAVGGGLALIGKLMGWSLFGLPAGLYGFFLSGLVLVAGSKMVRLAKVR
ncbi:MAG: sodium:solute symporter family protein [Deltaproteobacteria bacterium]|nr:sodium:solute symporter family protein [Deltaproteobacteria bacterium]MBW2077006.1 sodium:solute symporter family protein [Deltaproteobacteria bacterium]RLB31680.1 MAG: sodium:solute symporter family protein [Deltaproteobacteria bacterium]